MLTWEIIRICATISKDMVLFTLSCMNNTGMRVRAHTQRENGIVMSAGLRPRASINTVQSRRDDFHMSQYPGHPQRLLNSPWEKAPGAQEESLSIGTNGENSS